MIKHWIIGAGQIGCYLAACIKNSGHDIGIVARGQWQSRLGTGFSVTNYKGDKTEMSPLAVVNTLEEADIQPFDYIWLTVKCTSVAGIAKQLSEFVDTSNTIFCCQNGIGTKQIVRDQLGRHSAICLAVMVPFNVVWTEERLHRGSEGKLIIESPESDEVKNNLEEIRQNLLPLSFSDDIESVQWAKLQLNLGNAVNALSNMPVKSMLEDRGYRIIIAAAMRELLKVCKRQSIKLPRVAKLHGRFIPFVLCLPNSIFKQLGASMLAIDPTVRASMWWDVSQGKETEIEFLQGAVIERAISLGIPTPVNCTLLKEISCLHFTQNEAICISSMRLSQKIWHSG